MWLQAVSDEGMHGTGIGARCTEIRVIIKSTLPDDAVPYFLINLHRNYFQEIDCSEDLPLFSVLTMFDIQKKKNHCL